MYAPEMIGQMNYDDLGVVESLSAAERWRVGGSEVEVSCERLVGEESMES